MMNWEQFDTKKMKPFSPPTCPVVNVPMIHMKTGMVFSVSLYGVTLDEVTCVQSPCVSRMREAVRRLGFNPAEITTSLFWAKQEIIK